MLLHIKPENLRRYCFTAVAVVVSLLISVAIAIDLSPYLRGPGEWPPEWRWWYNPLNLIPWRLCVPILVLGMLIWWNRRARRMSEISTRMLLGLIALGVALQLGVQFTGRGGVQLVGRTLNTSYIGYFWPATRVDDLRSFLAIYAEQQPTGFMDYSPPDMPGGDNHFGRVANHPPGFTVYYWLILQAVRHFPHSAEIADLLIGQRADYLPSWAQPYTPIEILAGMLGGLGVTIIGSLTSVPLYRLGVATYGLDAGRRAAILYLLSPALTLFTPVADQLLTLASALTLWLVYTGQLRQSNLRLALAGLALAIGLFMSLGAVPIGIMTMIFIVVADGTRFRADPKGGILCVVRKGLILIAPFTGLWFLTWAWSGLNPIAVYSNITVIYRVIQNARNYYAWLFYGPYDILLFAGVAAALYLLRSSVKTASRLVRHAQDAADLLNLAFIVTMVSVFVSGSLRGEVARTLLYCLPPIALIAAGQLSTESNSETKFLMVAGAVALQLLVFHAVLLVYR